MIWQRNKKIKVKVVGYSLEARCFGPAPDETATIVLLHEGLGCVAMWRDFPEFLQKSTGLGVFAYSRRGYGGSDPWPLPWPLDYMTIEAREILPKILDQMGIKGAWLVGHSDGASIASIYCGSYPSDQRLKGLVLMAPHFFTEEMGQESIAQAKVAYETSSLREKMAKYHHHVDNTFYGWNNSWLDPEFEKNWNIETCLPAIKVPVLAIQGKHDQYGTIKQIDALEKGLGSCLHRVMLDVCRHSPHIDQTQKTVDLITTFIKSHD
jgi:pimeloyl-ACP methyl ester carboxylesterase